MSDNLIIPQTIIPPSKYMIRESHAQFKFVTESISDQSLPKGALLRLHGVYAIMDIHNDNFHKYDHTNYESVLKRVRPQIEMNALHGECEHVLKKNVDYNNVTHRVESVLYDEATKTYYGDILILDTIKGRGIIYPIASSGAPIFISSRALGDVNFKTGSVLLNYFVTYDVTAEPGFPQASFKPSKNQIVTESFVFESLDGSAYQAKKYFSFDNKNNTDMNDEMKQALLASINDPEVSAAMFAVFVKQLATDETSKQALAGSIMEIVSPNIATLIKESIEATPLAGAKLTDEDKADIVSNTISEVNKLVTESKTHTLNIVDGYIQKELLPHMKVIAQKTYVTESRSTLNLIDNYMSSTLVPSMVKFVTESSISMKTFDSYMQKEVKPAFQKFVTESAIAPKTFDRFMRTQMLPAFKQFVMENAVPMEVFDNYVEQELMPAIEEIVKDAGISAPAMPVDNSVMPELDKSYIVVADITAKDNTPFIKDSIVVVKAINEDSVSVALMNSTDALHEIDMNVWQNNTTAVVTESRSGSRHILSAAEAVNSAKTAIQTIQQKRALIESELNYCNESFVVNMPSKYRPIWESLDQSTKDTLAAQAKLRNISNSVDATKFWDSRDIKALQGSNFVNESKHTNELPFAEQLKRSVKI